MVNIPSSIEPKRHFRAAEQVSKPTKNLPMRPGKLVLLFVFFLVSLLNQADCINYNVRHYSELFLT